MSFGNHLVYTLMLLLIALVSGAALALVWTLLEDPAARKGLLGVALAALASYLAVPWLVAHNLLFGLGR